MKKPIKLNNDAYHRYLESPKWKRLRDAVVDRENGVCQGCGAESIEEVHHTTYSHIGDELLYQLVGLCCNCHRKAHLYEHSFCPFPGLWEGGNNES